MVPNHLELELIAKHIQEARVRDADAARQMANIRASNPSQQLPSALLWIASNRSRVRWWFRSRPHSPQPSAAPATPLVTEIAPAISLDTVSAAGALLPADSYEALMVIARGSRQRHERLVSRRS